MAGGALGNNLKSTIDQMSGRGQGIGGTASEVGRMLAPPTSRGYVPSYSVPQNAPLPVLQSTQNAPAQQVQQAGLQALMANMMAQYQNVPGAFAMTQRPQMPAPRFSAPALSYRPNMAPAQASLGRVAVSVAEQQRRAAVAEAERLKAENEALQQQQYYGGLQSYYDWGGGG